MNSELGRDKSSCLPIQVIYFCHMHMIVPYSNHQTDSRAKSYQHLLMWVWKSHKLSCLSHILIVTPKLLLLYPLQSRIWPASPWGRPRFRGGFQQYGADLRGSRDVRHRRHAVAGVGVWPGEWSCCGRNGGEMGVSPYFWMVYNRKSQLQVDDDWGYPYLRKPPNRSNMGRKHERSAENTDVIGKKLITRNSYRWTSKKAMERRNRNSHDSR